MLLTLAAAGCGQADEPPLVGDASAEGSLVNSDGAAPDRADAQEAFRSTPNDASSDARFDTPEAQTDGSVDAELGPPDAQADVAVVAPRPRYWLGADISFVPEDEARGITYSDGSRTEIIAVLKAHGFNAIRLRTFVDPRAADGYDQARGFGDLAHTLAFARRIKAAGMAFLLDFHYSDNWADPGKQCVPVAWQGLSLPQLAQALHDYTTSTLAQLTANGASPDMVQIGNEISAGLLLHICGKDGLPMANSAVNGSVANWSALGTLLKAGIEAVHEVDRTLPIMLHLDRGGDKPQDSKGAAFSSSVDWITKAQQQGVSFDVLGESSYQLYQGDEASSANTVRGWESTYGSLAARFPALRFVAAEYGPLQREINDVIFNLPGRRGLGTFNWEPTRETAGNVGHTLFATSGNPRLASPELSLYDSMREAYDAGL